MRVLLVLGFLSLAAPAYAQTTDPGLADGSLRKLCYGQGQQQCTVLPYAEAIGQQTLPLPPPVEAAYEKGYLPIQTAVQTTGGLTEKTYCGSFLAERERRLVIASLHCVPSYANQLDGKYMTALGIPLTFIAKIPDADLVLLQLAQIPANKDAITFAEPVVQEPVYGRSIQQTSIANVSGTKNETETGYFVGPVTFYGNVAAKGQLGSSRYNSATDAKGPTYDVIPTPYEVLRISGGVEPGFSGSPLYNQWGQVIGIVTSGPGPNPAPNMFYAMSAKNFSALLALYKDPQ